MPDREPRVPDGVDVTIPSVARIYNRALLATDDGVIIVKADLREPDQVLGDPALSRLIDFSQPVAVLFLAVLHFIGDEETAAAVAARSRHRYQDHPYPHAGRGGQEALA